MKVLIELPTWMGDTVMTTPAIENLVSHFVDVEITLVGSFISTELLTNHSKVIETYVLEKNYFNLYKLLKHLSEFDLFISFRSSFRSRFINFFVSAKNKYQFNKNKYNNMHQVEKYNSFINDSLKINTLAGRLILDPEKKIKGKKNKLVGINPGASYGSAKRWYPKEFAVVAKDLSNQYDIIIFGGPSEKDIAQDIEKYLIKYGIDNYQNLAARLSIKELLPQIANLDLFITGDSGPMHLASAFQIPTISIFGPTNYNETSQWMNKSSKVIKKKLECQPCMKRECPLKHHDCMKLIKASTVIDAVKKLN
jgi:heptosyltransferase II